MVQHARCAGARNILSEDSKRLSELQSIRERDLGGGPMCQWKQTRRDLKNRGTWMITIVLASSLILTTASAAIVFSENHRLN